MTQLDSRGIVEISDGGVSVELRGETMSLNIGPQHQSTHGVLRLVGLALGLVGRAAHDEAAGGKGHEFGHEIGDRGRGVPRGGRSTS